MGMRLRRGHPSGMDPHLRISHSPLATAMPDRLVERYRPAMRPAAPTVRSTKRAPMKATATLRWKKFAAGRRHRSLLLSRYSYSGVEADGPARGVLGGCSRG